MIVALLASFALPAIRMLFNSFQSQSGTRAMISAALASARAIAAEHQRYAGIRFQNKYQEDNKGCQYMIFIVQDPEILAWGFRAVEGIEPLKLPDSVGVMDLTLVQRTYTLYTVSKITEVPINDNSLIDQPSEVSETTTFSIIFSPSGKLVVHQVQVRNRNGFPDTSTNNDSSDDDIFNKKGKVDAGLAMFYQDDYCGAWWSPWSGQDFGFGPEFGRNSFIIYERDKFEETYKKGRAWSDYLEDLASQKIYINPYTGTMINR